MFSFSNKICSTNKLFKLSSKLCYSLIKPRILNPIKNFKIIMNERIRIRQVNSLTFSQFSTKSDQLGKEYIEEYKKYELILKEAEELSQNLLKNLKRFDEQSIIEFMTKMNELNVRFSQFEELKQFILINLNKIPLTKPNSIITFIKFIDKLEIQDLDKNFGNIDKKIRSHILNKSFKPEELSTLIYAYSKFQITDKEIWESFTSQLDGHILNLGLDQTTQILLAVTMIQSLDHVLITNSNSIYTQLIKNIEGKISLLTHIDTFRICISMTKRLVSYSEFSESIWQSLQRSFIKDISYFDLYQISIILLLFSETPYLNQEIFAAVEKEVTEYLNNLDEMQKVDNFNVSSFVEDLSKISFGFALNRQGSNYLWNSLLKTFNKLQGNISILSLENLLFVCYRLIDILIQSAGPSSNTDSNEIKELYNLFKFLETKIVNEKLLEENKINSFNAMMPFARLNNTNEQIWAILVRNILTMMSEKNLQGSQGNSFIFMLNDIIFAFSNYYINLITSISESKDDISNKYFIKNFQKFWNKIEELIINIDEKTLAVPNLANMIIDLSQIDLELNKAWSFLSENVIIKINEFDINNFVMILMGFSQRKNFSISNNISDKDKQIWIKFEEYVKDHISEFSIDLMRKIVVSFLKHREISRELWIIIEEKFSQNDNLSALTFEYFIDLQIPFAITGISSEKIWNKFEEIVFRNLKFFVNDKDYLMNTVYSFSRVGRGSQVFWNKFTSLIVENIDSYDIDDLGHIITCLKSDLIEKKHLGNILNQIFWDKFSFNVEQKLNSAKLNTLNILLKGINENLFLSRNDKLVKEIDNKITEMLKDIRK